MRRRIIAPRQRLGWRQRPRRAAGARPPVQTAGGFLLPSPARIPCSPDGSRWLRMAGEALTGTADLVRDSCTQLAGYRSALERLVTQASSPQGGMAPRPADVPFPGDAQAFAALMVIWEKVPRLEATLKLAVAGHPGLRRGGSAGTFLEALDAIPGLAAGLDEDDEAAAARILEWLLDVARAVPAIDEAQRWRYLRGRACPYCGCWALKVLLDAAGRPSGHVECHAAPVTRDGVEVWCADRNGLRPAAMMGTDAHGRPALMWADGLTETVPDLDG